MCMAEPWSEHLTPPRIISNLSFSSCSSAVCVSHPFISVWVCLVLPGRDLQKGFLHNWRFFSLLWHIAESDSPDVSNVFLSRSVSPLHSCVSVWVFGVCWKKSLQKNLSVSVHAYMYLTMHLHYQCQSSPESSSKCWCLIPRMMMTCIITCSSRHIM